MGTDDHPGTGVLCVSCPCVPRVFVSCMSVSVFAPCVCVLCVLVSCVLPFFHVVAHCIQFNSTAITSIQFNAFQFNRCPPLFMFVCMCMCVSACISFLRALCVWCLVFSPALLSIHYNPVQFNRYPSNSISAPLLYCVCISFPRVLCVWCLPACLFIHSNSAQFNCHYIHPIYMHSSSINASLLLCVYVFLFLFFIFVKTLPAIRPIFLPPSVDSPRVYGYGNSGGEIPEGYIDVTLPGNRQQKILHPAYPGSVYHTTK